MDDAYQVELAEEYHHFPAREYQSKRGYTAASNHSKEVTPLYAESINMLKGLPSEEVDRYLEEHPKIVPLFEVDIIAAVGPYITSPESDEPDQEAIWQLRKAHESLEKEMTIS